MGGYIRKKMGIVDNIPRATALVQPERVDPLAQPLESDVNELKAQTSKRIAITDAEQRRQRAQAMNRASSILTKETLGGTPSAKRLLGS